MAGGEGKLEIVRDPTSFDDYGDDEPTRLQPMAFDLPAGDVVSSASTTGSHAASRTGRRAAVPPADIDADTMLDERSIDEMLSGLAQGTDNGLNPDRHASSSSMALGPVHPRMQSSPPYAIVYPIGANTPSNGFPLAAVVVADPYSPYGVQLPFAGSQPPYAPHPMAPHGATPPPFPAPPPYAAAPSYAAAPAYAGAPSTGAAVATSQRSRGVSWQTWVIVVLLMAGIGVGVGFAGGWISLSDGQGEAARPETAAGQPARASTPVPPAAVPTTAPAAEAQVAPAAPAPAEAQVATAPARAADPPATAPPSSSSIMSLSVVSLAHPIATVVASPGRGEVARSFLEAGRPVKKGEKLFEITRRVVSAKAAARVEELERLAKEDPVYEAFLEKARRAKQAASTTVTTTVRASRAGVAEPMAKTADKVEENQPLATIGDPAVWIARARLTGADRPADKWSCSIAVANAGPDKKAPCQLEKVVDEDGGGEVFVRVDADRAEWLRAVGQEQQLVLEPPPGAR